MTPLRPHLLVAGLLLCPYASAFAQGSDDTRTQYPRLLQNSYIAINVGAVDQPFSQAELQPGFRAASIDVPRIDVRVMLVGHEFNRFLSAQASYMRPVNYVTYTSVRPGDTDAHHVRVNFGGVTLKAHAPLRGRWSAYGEGGLGFTSRTGFDIGDTPVVTDAHYASPLVGGGIEYRITPAWDLTGGVTYSPGRAAVNQPRTVFSSGGFRYTMRPLPPDRVEANRDAGFIFPRLIVQVEYSSGTGYAVNNFVSRKVPIFWGGHAKVDFGIAPHYERNVFHTRRVFGLDVGASAGFYKTRENNDRFYTLSVYPLFRFTFLRAYRPPFHVPGFHGDRMVRGKEQESQHRREDQPLLERQHLHAERGCQDSADVQPRIRVLAIAILLNQPEWVCRATRWQPARAEPADDQVARRFIAVTAVDHGRAERGAANRVREADSHAADGDRSKCESPHRQTESQRCTAESEGEADRESADRDETDRKTADRETAESDVADGDDAFCRSWPHGDRVDAGTDVQERPAADCRR